MRPPFFHSASFFSSPSVTGYSWIQRGIFTLAAAASIISSSNAEPKARDYPPVKLRAYGTISGTFIPDTIDGKPVSTLRIVCEDESKAKLVQAKYLSDLQT